MLRDYLKENPKYVAMSELKQQGFQSKEITSLLESGELEKIKPGLYRPFGLPTVFRGGIYKLDVCMSIPEAVLCLTSALDYYELTTDNPSRVHIAVPHSKKVPKIIYPPVEVYYMTEKYYSIGINEVITEYGVAKIYDIEKTICDVFRYRKRLGEELAFEALKKYLLLKNRDMIKLERYAKLCGVKSILGPYLKAMVA